MVLKQTIHLFYYIHKQLSIFSDTMLDTLIELLDYLFSIYILL